MAQKTLLQLRTSARSLADMTDSEFVSDAELNDYINVAWAKTYDLMITSYGENYFGLTTPQTIAADGVNTMFDLATDFYKLLGVDALLSGDPANTFNWFTIYPFNFGERNRGAIVPYLNNISRPVDLRYRLQGNKLWITPLPNAGFYFRVWYAPTLTPLVSDSDTVTNLQPGWEELIELDAAVKCLIKSEQDISSLASMRSETVTRLMAAVAQRDVAAPATVVDVYGPGSASGMGPYDGGIYGGGYA
jgi:hypothetical protein